MQNLSRNIFTSLYQTENSCVICSLKLTQRKASSPAVEIEAPLSILKPSIVKINTLSTTHSFIIHDVQNGTYSDFVNSIALCLIQARIPCEIVVASSLNNSLLLYSPANNFVEFFYSEDLSNPNIFDLLKKNCIETYQRLLSNSSI